MKKEFSILLIFLVIAGILIAQVLIRKEVSVTIEILADMDFTLTVDGQSYEVHRGEDLVLIITADYINDFDGEVMLSTKDVPPGVAVTFDKNPLSNTNDPVTEETNLQCHMTISIATNATIGSLTFILVGEEVGT